MQTLNQQLLDKVLNIAYQAGEHLTHFYSRTVEVQIKSDKTPVTEADLFISQFVTEKLKELTPEIPVLSEENCKIPLAARSQWKEYWIVDPLDGTQQFIDRTDQFSVVIGLIQQNTPVLGIIHSPILRKTYYAMKNHGAFLKENNHVQPLMKNCKIFDKSHRLQVTIGNSNGDKIHQAVRPPYQVELLQYGSSSLKAGLVAEGKADCYIRLGDTGEWDTAAAEILLAETGGEVFDLDFNPLTYNQRETFVNPHFIMVGNKHHDWRSTFHFNK